MKTERRNTRLFATVTVAVVLILGIVLISPSQVEAGSSGMVLLEHRSTEAEIARYNAWADYYAESDARGVVANAARYNAMAAFYCAQDAARAEVSAARYNAWVDYYVVNAESRMAASAARYNAWAAYFGAMSNDAGMAAYAARYQAMADAYMPLAVACAAW